MQLSTSVTESDEPAFLLFLRQQGWYQSLAKLITKPLRPLIGEREAKRLVKYGMVGVSGTVIELGLLNFFIFALGWNSDTQKIAANMIAVSLAIASNFTWNRLWTFAEVGGDRRAQFFKFVLVSVIGMLVNSVIFFLSDKYLFGPWLHSLAAVQLAKFTAIAITLMWNFTANRFWTFK